MYAYSQSEAVEDRHDCQHLVSRSEHRICGHYLLRQSVEIQIGKENSLHGSRSSSAVKDHRRILRLTHRMKRPVIFSSVQKEFLPPYYFGIGRHLFDLSTLYQVIALSLYRAENVFNTGEYEISQLHILSDVLEFSVELI